MTVTYTPLTMEYKVVFRVDEVEAHTNGTSRVWRSHFFETAHAGIGLAQSYNEKVLQNVQGDVPDPLYFMNIHGWVLQVPKER